MKTQFLTLISLIMIAFTMQAAAETITIFNLGDTHSCLAPAGPRDNDLNGTSGGAARAATVIGSAKMTDPNTILLHSGDIFIGDLFFNTYFGVPELTILKQLGCDALTLGNHEFDLTPDVLYLSIANAFADGGFSLISSNFETFDNPDLEGLNSLIDDYVIIERAGLKIGVFGLTTPETNVMSLPAPVFIDTNIVEIAAVTVATLQAQDCNMIIMSSHLGKTYDEALAYYVDGIDLIIGGHDHDILTEPQTLYTISGNSVPYIQSGAFYQSMGKSTVTFDGGDMVSIDYELITLDEEIPEEENTKAAVDQMIAGIEETYGPMYTAQVATAPEDLREECVPEFIGVEYLDTPVGNLVCDAFRAYGETDIAIQPGGSTSQGLKAGPLVGDDIFRMIGYGFNEYNGLGYRIVTFDILGSDLLFGLEFGLSEIENNDEYLLQVSGMRYSCNLKKDPFRRVKDVYIGDNAIDPEKTYSVTANEFVIMFLDYLGLPYSNLNLNEELTEFEVVLGYVSASGETSVEEGRIQTPVIPKKNKGNKSKSVVFTPNPCYGQVRVAFNIETQGYYTLQVFSMHGETVADSYSFYSEGSNEIFLNTEDFTHGLYLFRLTGNNNTISGRFVVK